MNYFSGLESKVYEMQDNLDQMEGLNAQEMAKIKHMVSITFACSYLEMFVCRR